MTSELKWCYPEQHLCYSISDPKSGEWKQRNIQLFHGNEVVRHPDFTPLYFKRFICVIGSIKHHWAPIDTSIRAAATSVIPLSYHQVFLNLNGPVFPALQKLLVVLTQSNKESLHPVFLKFLFCLACICPQAANTVPQSLCVHACTLVGVLKVMYWANHWVTSHTSVLLQWFGPKLLPFHVTQSSLPNILGTSGGEEDK